MLPSLLARRAQLKHRNPPACTFSIYRTKQDASTYLKHNLSRSLKIVRDPVNGCTMGSCWEWSDLVVRGSCLKTDRPGLTRQTQHETQQKLDSTCRLTPHHHSLCEPIPIPSIMKYTKSTTRNPLPPDKRFSQEQIRPDILVSKWASTSVDV